MAKASDRGYQGDLFGHTKVSGGELSSVPVLRGSNGAGFSSQFIHLILVVLSVM